MNLYLDLFQNAGEEEEELADILTNMLACASNQDSGEARASVEKLVEKTSGQVERTYEFFFNLCQV